MLTVAVPDHFRQLADREESLWPVIRVIVWYGLTVAFWGVFEYRISPLTVVFDLLPTIPISLPTPLAELGTSLYFSVVTFTTLGYGDLQPASSAAQALATIESFLGALLMALLVFVLGRRSTW